MLELSSCLLMMRQYLPPVLLSILFFIIFSATTIYRHLTFNSHAFDLGIYTQATYLYSQGEIAYSTLKNMTLLGDHFGPILILFSPIYKLFPNPFTLLIIQSFFVAASCIPLYLIAVHRLRSHLLALFVSLAYLASAGILAAVAFDFHLATISVLPLSLILYSWIFNRWKLYWLFLTLSLLFKEDIPIFILGLGIFELFQKQFKIGFTTIIIAFISFFTIKFKLMPFIWPGTQNIYLNTSILPLDAPIDLALLLFLRPDIIFSQVFDSPVKLATFNNLYQTFAFLPILSPLSWLTVFPYLFLRFTSSYIQLWTVNFHHNANLLPFLFTSTILAIERFKIPVKPTILLIMFFFMIDITRGNLVRNVFYLNFDNIAKFSYIDNVIKQIPPQASIAAQSPLVPHLANREKIYLYPQFVSADYVVLDTQLDGYPMHRNQVKTEIQKLKDSKYWQVWKESKTLVIFKKVTAERSL